MVFCGAESGSDAVLKRMDKGTTTAQILEVAVRATREHGIIPEFSFVFGDPDDAKRRIENTLEFVHQLKTVNPTWSSSATSIRPLRNDGARTATSTRPRNPENAGGLDSARTGWRG